MSDELKQEALEAIRGSIMSRAKTTRKSLLHVIADCSECDWYFGNYLGNYMKEAKAHVNKTGHEVIVETGYSQRITKV